MSLQTSLQYMARQAFRSLNGTLLPGTYMNRAVGSYDPQTGTVLSPAPALYDVRVLVSQYRQQEIDGTRVLASDRRLCIEQSMLPIVPSARDWIEIGHTVWNVLDIRQDAAGLVWEFQGRAAGDSLESEQQ
jgi:hypothetical protein